MQAMEKNDLPEIEDGKAAPDRRPWETPKLIEYGSVAKLTQSGGSTLTESGVPVEMMMPGCL
jgi:hypothetical protein